METSLIGSTSGEGDPSSVDLDIHRWKLTPVAGGCIHRAYVMESDPPCFVKMNRADHAVLFEAEMDSLKAIAETGTIRVPFPRVFGSAGEESFLVLEFLTLRDGATSSWRLMGEHLAALHRRTSADGRFGWHRDNFIGATPQTNEWRDTWPAFWREQRLGVQFRLAAQNGMRFEGVPALLDRVESFFTNYSPSPSLLHGDLWSGNASFLQDGTPVIYDPACYFGDRECDTAFTELFGGFPRAFYDGYDAAWPRNEEWRSRRDLYNLYHVLNHANLFGGSYRAQAQEMIQVLNAGG